MDLLNMLTLQGSDDVNPHGVFKEQRIPFTFRSSQMNVTIRTAKGILGWYSGCDVVRKSEGFGWAPANTREVFPTEEATIDSVIKIILQYYGEKECTNLVKQYKEWQSLNT